MLSDIERDALEDIRDNIARAMQFVHGLDFESFLVDLKTLTDGTALQADLARRFNVSQATISRITSS
jgi:hypothetical protein